MNDAEVNRNKIDSLSINKNFRGSPISELLVPRLAEPLSFRFP